MTAGPPLSLPTACSAADQKEMIGMPNADPPSKFGINEKSVFSAIKVCGQLFMTVSKQKRATPDSVLESL